MEAEIHTSALIAAHVTAVDGGPLDVAHIDSLPSILVLSLCFGHDVTSGFDAS